MYQQNEIIAQKTHTMKGIIKENRLYINKKSGNVWQLNWIDHDGRELVMVKCSGKPLTKVITMKNFDKNWKIRKQ